jgi:ABC-2 type transport system ATP-binding protein
MADVIIDVQALTKQYKTQKAVDSVSFQITRGMICGLIGPNGAGKTTVMKMLGGLVLPTAGAFTIFGGQTERELAHARTRMSFIIETPYAKGKLSARDNIEKMRLQKGIPDKSRTDEVLKLVGLSDTGKKPAAKFSLGMRQRLGIAGALLSRPEIMVLDEPVDGLDPVVRHKLWRYVMQDVAERSATVLISSHNLRELEGVCDSVGIISGGEMKLEGDIEDLKNYVTKLRENRGEGTETDLSLEEVFLYEMGEDPRPGAKGGLK